MMIYYAFQVWILMDPNGYRKDFPKLPTNINIAKVTEILVLHQFLLQDLQ